MERETIKMLEQINKTLTEINIREGTSEMMSNTNKILERSDRHVEYSIQQIQNSFDRIHDKVFNFNNIMIGAFLVLGTFPSDSPHLPLWTIVFPILNLVLMIYIDYRQMEIHRFASNQQNWSNDEERNEYGKKISNQTKLSLIALILSLCCLIYLIIKVI